MLDKTHLLYRAISHQIAPPFQVMLAYISRWIKCKQYN